MKAINKRKIDYLGSGITIGYVLVVLQCICGCSITYQMIGLSMLTLYNGCRLKAWQPITMGIAFAIMNVYFLFG